MKINKIIQFDGENSSSQYGNAFLGPNLWEKNEILEGEKLGLKFESLEMDQFLNENGLNNTDIEFLDQLQKFESNNNNNTVGAIQRNLMIETSAISSYSSSAISSTPSSSLSPNSTCAQTSEHSFKQLLEKRVSNTGVKQQTSFDIYQRMQSTPKTNDFIPSPNHLSSELNQRKNSFDWSLNELSIDSVSDDFDISMRKYTDDELRPQQIMKKSRKVILINLSKIFTAYNLLI